ncbi:MAG: Glutamyl-tRNA reductase [Alphaproteobacteria bacterium ADurb.BinA280]|nr:MAG: Glutamyl-tRNA reductase [Alphaproteobacteria bacterium ADurb.BinA280]
MYLKPLSQPAEYSGARRLIALGLNHQTASIDLRARVAVSAELLPEALESLLRQEGVLEASVISTCNRTEVYCCVEAGAEAVPAEWLAMQHRIELNELRGSLYQHVDGAAVRHLFRVATGLDSLVLGEPQILGQVKDAWQHSRNAGAVKAALDRLFQHSFAVAKRVRTDTRIGAHPVSVAFASVRLAQRVFAELSQATVLLIGAGETIELTARHLADQNVKRLLIANRTYDNAHALAQRFGGYALGLDELLLHLPEADIVFSATAATDPIVSRSDVAYALKKRRHKPMLLMDLAVPRDIDPAVGELDDVFLYTVDDLDQVIEEGMRSRREAAEQAEAIIDLQVDHFLAWWRASDQQGVIRHIRSQAESERDALLLKAQQMLVQGKAAEDVLRFLATTLTNKLLHAPSANLRAAAQRGDIDLLRAGERLFAATDVRLEPTAESEPRKDSDDAEHPQKTRRAG